MDCGARIVIKPQPDRDHIAANPVPPRMLVTARIARNGYATAVKGGKLAIAENITLRQAAERPGFVGPEDVDRWLVPATMAVPGASLPGGGG